MKLLGSVKLVINIFLNECIWCSTVTEGNFSHILPVVRDT